MKDVVGAEEEVVKVPDKVLPNPFSGLANPHEEVKGTLFEDEVLKWWKQQRTHVLEQTKMDELLEGLKPDPSVEEYFKAPDMPKPSGQL